MAEYILEAGGTMAFTFHVLFMLFNLFIIYQFYFNDKFYCSGNFCSYNCALAYNIDQNDNVWKKTSLLNLLLVAIRYVFSL